MRRGGKEEERERERVFFFVNLPERRSFVGYRRLEEMGLEAETYYDLVGQMISLFIEFSDAQTTEFCVW